MSLPTIPKCCWRCGGIIGPDITGRSMCYGCGPVDMMPLDERNKRRGWPPEIALPKAEPIRGLDNALMRELEEDPNLRTLDKLSVETLLRAWEQIRDAHPPETTVDNIRSGTLAWGWFMERYRGEIPVGGPVKEIYGIRITIDRDVPADEMHFRNKAGVVLNIFRVGPETKP